MDREDGKRIDHFVRLGVGQTIDLGWGTATLNEDQTVTRTCKGCGVTVTTAVVANKVAEAEIHHQPRCPVLDRLGNNAVRS